MKIVKASWEILGIFGGLELIELAARTCYKSEAKIQPGTAAPFIRDKILAHETPHLSVIEHASMTAKFIVDRGVSHELVRHRLASFSQESSRYCGYNRDSFGGEITVIEPCFWEPGSPSYAEWYTSMQEAEHHYMRLIESGAKPEQARSVLPNSLKTEIVMTANLREWRHVFKLRTSPRAHPQMREVTVPLLAEVRARVPIVFDEIEKG